MRRAMIWAATVLSLVAAAFAVESKNPRNIAIIGAGAAGSSTAYHLQKYAEEDGVAVNITIFEKTDRIGGRTLTINPFGNPSDRVELGASIFVEINAILYNATKEFGLETTGFGDGDRIMAIWDGDKFVLEIDQSLPSWRIVLKIFWKYGVRGPVNANRLMKATIAKFLNLYQAPYFPFRSLTERANELDLLEATSLTGEEFLRKNNVADIYAHDIVQASTRVNYASNLAHIHGLDTMVSMAPEGAMSVIGGNWRIFDKMVSKSGAAVAFNTSVTSIALDQNKDSASATPKYSLKTRVSTSEAANDESYPALFDHVVIATPYQFSDIKAADGLLQQPIDEIPYIKLHVTIFASPFSFSPAFFNFSSGTRVPDTVLTTLADGDVPTSGVQGAGKAGFYSISTIGRAFNPKTGKLEYLYKIFSPEKVTADFLSSLLGVTIPKDFTGETSTGGEGDSHVVEPISWYYPHVFYSYPKAYPRVTFQDPIIRDGLYYTSGMDSFISTMETNALMGMNVARLIVDDISDAVGGGAEPSKGEHSLAQDDQQVLANAKSSEKPTLKPHHGDEEL